MADSSEIVPGARVHYRASFSPPGTVVAVHGEWAWVMFDDYPDDHEPTTHEVWLLSPVVSA